jgi:alkanesulfonate monooxygenase SsuD/methylene tetrahydromethanopterin reductase-like flavin-dependent oxidoreductase (luciferase family)
VHIGVCYFPTDYGIDIRELARADEERGFESLFLPEHTHIPKSRRTPYPGGRRVAQGVLSHARSIRCVVLCGRRNHQNPAGHRSLPHPAT